MAVTDVSNAPEDSLDFKAPATPSALREMPDEELFELSRKNAYANEHASRVKIEHEMNARLILALKTFKVAADRSSRTLNVLTAVLVVLTVVLVVFR